MVSSDVVLLMKELMKTRKLHLHVDSNVMVNPNKFHYLIVAQTFEDQANLKYVEIRVQVCCTHTEGKWTSRTKDKNWNWCFRWAVSEVLLVSTFNSFYFIFFQTSCIKFFVFCFSVPDIYTDKLWCLYLGQNKNAAIKPDPNF